MKWSLSGHMLSSKLTHARTAVLGMINSTWRWKPVSQNLGQKGQIFPSKCREVGGRASNLYAKVPTTIGSLGCSEQ